MMAAIYLKNLTKQKSKIALQIATLTMDRQSMYYEASLQLAELRQEAFQLEGYHDIAELLPSKLQNSMDYLYFKWMNDAGRDKITDLFQYIPFLLFFFSYVGAGWYIFISFQTSSILLDDFEHSSLIQGFPVRFDSYILSKCMISLFTIITSFLLIFYLRQSIVGIKWTWQPTRSSRHIRRRCCINLFYPIYRDEPWLYVRHFHFRHAIVDYIKCVTEKYVFNIIYTLYFVLFTDDFFHH
ncbi:hypothetical protein OL548_22485 [Lysinibacillus sp. MHQ-1]|nr:hypothetical protein OL548_22485 [Lysinibacillus sp. MHQ-1]